MNEDDVAQLELLTRLGFRVELWYDVEKSGYFASASHRLLHEPVANVDPDLTHGSISIVSAIYGLSFRVRRAFDEQVEARGR